MVETALILIGLWFVAMMLIGVLFAYDRHEAHDDDEPSALPLDPKHRKHHPSDREET